MPIYEYACEECKKQFEIMQKITDAPLTACPDCKGSLRKMISSTSFVLKGTGWYVTDYASKKGAAEKTCKPVSDKESKSGNEKESTSPAPAPAPDTSAKTKETAPSST
jgi:putative FmdB family regulatory protein